MPRQFARVLDHAVTREVRADVATRHCLVGHQRVVRPIDVFVDEGSQIPRGEAHLGMERMFP